MKVFIAWSGDISQKVAIVLREWLPGVIAALEPYVSAEDMGKGDRWGAVIAKQLEESSYGILCVTRSNIDAPWLNHSSYKSLQHRVHKLNDEAKDNKKSTNMKSSFPFEKSVSSRIQLP